MKILIFRTIIIYICVLFAMRLMGKRQLGQLEPSELVSTILISNLASISIESPDIPLTASLVPLFLITAIELLNAILSYKSQQFSTFAAGRANTVIRDGVINQSMLRRIGLNMGELLEALRAKDIFDPSEVSYAIIETNGSLSVAKKPENDALTREQYAHGTVPEAPLPKKALVPFVIDGNVLKENLVWCGKSEKWLAQMAAEHSTTPALIMILLGDDTNQYYLVKKEGVATATPRGDS